METQFRNLDRAIDSQPMPPQFQDTKAMVSCNDCYAKSAVKYHWLGLKCAICDSYNTAQLSILSDPAVEVPSIEPRESEREISPHDLGELEGLLSVHQSAMVTRSRRHSSHTLPIPLQANLARFSPYPLPPRLGRSVSPVRGLRLLDSLSTPGAVESDDSEDEEELDFWGRGEVRSTTSAEMVDMAMDMDENDDESDDDSVSAVDECEEEEEDQFAIFGHR